MNTYFKKAAGKLAKALVLAITVSVLSTPGAHANGTASRTISWSPAKTWYSTSDINHVLQLGTPSASDSDDVQTFQVNLDNNSASCWFNSSTQAFAFAQPGTCAVRVHIEGSSVYAPASSEWVTLSLNSEYDSIAWGNQPPVINFGSVSHIHGGVAVSETNIVYSVAPSSASICEIQSYDPNTNVIDVNPLAFGTCTINGTTQDSTFYSGTTTPISFEVQDLYLQGISIADSSGHHLALTAPTGVQGFNSHTYNYFVEKSSIAHDGNFAITVDAGSQTSTLEVENADTGKTLIHSGVPFNYTIAQANDYITIINSLANGSDVRYNLFLNRDDVLTTTFVGNTDLDWRSFYNWTDEPVILTGISLTGDSEFTLGTATESPCITDGTAVMASGSLCYAAIYFTPTQASDPSQMPTATVTVTGTRESGLPFSESLTVSRPAVYQPQVVSGFWATQIRANQTTMRPLTALGGGIIHYSVVAPNTSGCAVASDSPTFTYANIGSCTVRIEVPQVGVYAAYSHDYKFDVAIGTRKITAQLSTASPTTATSVNLSATGYIGSGAISYTLTAGSAITCAISGSTLVSTAAGRCGINAHIAAAGAYAKADSVAVWATFTLAPVVVTPAPAPTPSPIPSPTPSPTPTNPTNDTTTVTTPTNPTNPTNDTTTVTTPSTPPTVDTPTVVTDTTTATTPNSGSGSNSGSGTGGTGSNGNTPSNPPVTPPAPNGPETGTPGTQNPDTSTVSTPNGGGNSGSNSGSGGGSNGNNSTGDNPSTPPTIETPTANTDTSTGTTQNGGSNTGSNGSSNNSGNNSGNGGGNNNQAPAAPFIPAPVIPSTPAPAAPAPTTDTPAVTETTPTPNVDPTPTTPVEVPTETTGSQNTGAELTVKKVTQPAPIVVLSKLTAWPNQAVDLSVVGSFTGKTVSVVNQSVCTVSLSGKVSALKSGDCVINITTPEDDKHFASTRTVTIKVLAPTIKVVPSITVKGYAKFTIGAGPAYAKKIATIWSAAQGKSAAKKIATVKLNANGIGSISAPQLKGEKYFVKVGSKVIGTYPAK